MNIDFEKLCEDAHKIAVKRGDWDNPPSTETLACRIHRSISNAFTEWEKHGVNEPIRFTWGSCTPLLERAKEGDTPYGLAIELADVVIQLAAWCEAFGYKCVRGELTDCVHSFRERPFHEWSFCEWLNACFAETYCMSERSPLPSDFETFLGLVVSFAEQFNIPLAEAIEIKLAYERIKLS